MKSKDFNSPELSFSPAMQAHIDAKIIKPRVDMFMVARDLQDAEIIQIRGRKTITDLNFHSVKIGYFYKQLFKDIKKGSNKISTIHYSITHDKYLAKLQCPQTSSFYNEICLGKKPIFFFLYFDVDEIINEIRSCYSLVK